MAETLKDFPEWPPEALQEVPVCPACGSQHRRQLHSGLTDQVFGATSGEWTLFKCDGCDSAWLDPRPKDEFLGRVYAGYFTHSPPKDRVIVRRKGVVRRILHDIVNGYLESQFRVSRKPRLAGWLLYLIPPLRVTCDAMCRHLPTPKVGARLLDVGCGNGGFLMLARAMGWDADGVDFDECAAAQARSQGFHVVVGGVEALSEQHDVYDVITSSHVLEHVPDPAAHLRTLFSLLKPGGVLWLQTPNLKSLGARLYGSHWRGLEAPRHLVLFNVKSLRRLLDAVGFVDVRDKPDAGQAFVVLRASEAIRRGLPVDNSSSDKSRLPLELAIEGVEWFVPSSREFLTVMCSKPEM